MKSQMWWIVGLVVAFIAGSMFFGKGNIGNLLPIAILLLCPVMMIFMMRGHKH